MLSHKRPRDFIWLDELRKAHTDWPEQYPGNKVWLNIHEYRATLAGERPHLRLLISGGPDSHLVWQTTPDGAHEMQRMLNALPKELGHQALQKLGFEWKEDVDD